MKQEKHVTRVDRPRPIIGVTPDESTPSTPHAVPRYELKRAYADAVLAAGGLPIVLPYAEEGPVLEQYFGMIDGLVVTGGAFDVPPELYGEKPREGLGELKPARTGFELMLLELALARDLPVLGVCGGMQLLNVVCGGTLYQDIRREVPGALAHEQEGDRRLPAHEVAVTTGTRLAAAVGPGSLIVNSTHHQAVRKVGKGLIVSAASPDGIIEAIEHPERRFALGVQWHPELLFKSVPINRSLYRAFIHAAAGEQPASAAS